MAVNFKDVAAGLIFIAVGAFFAVSAYAQLRVGTTFRMGPGYFPILIGLVLVGLGTAIVVRSLGHVATPFGPVPWRGIVLITLAPIVFGTTIEGLGLVPSVVLTVLVSGFASRRMGAPLAIALSVGLSVFCVLVFKLGLGLPLQMFGPWLSA
jgi:hypothetical protein